MRHYYTDNSDLISESHSFTFTYQTKNIVFTTDRGVFSKQMIDYGTRVLLSSIRINKHHQHILDVGCGYGGLGISLKVANPHIKVDLVDINSRALTLCKYNIEQNKLPDMHVYYSDIYEQVTGCYDMILSNPPIRAGKKVVQTILKDSYTHLKDTGELWIVIQKKQGAPSAMKMMEAIFNNVTIVKRDKGYYVLKAVK